VSLCFLLKKSIFSSKAGAKVQTFFHSAKLFLKKIHNTLITKQKFLSSLSSTTPLQNRSSPLFS
jgi:hypothetical protein